MIVTSDLQGTVVHVGIAAGSVVRGGDVLMLIESMKMHHEVVAPSDGVVTLVHVELGDTLVAGATLLELDVDRSPAATAGADADESLDGTGATDVRHEDGSAAPGSPAAEASRSRRADLGEVEARHDLGLDAARPEAVASRRRRGRRTARENLADLVDEGTFVEYGPLVIAAQRRRRPVDDLIVATPADGLVGGIGDVNGGLFDDERARKCVVMSYDYTVLAGTQGQQNHRKKDRLFELAAELRLPVVFFTEGGGGRPGDTDGVGVSGLDCLAFRWFAELSGSVPLVGVNAGYCFAGNAAILGCCDVVIATEDSNIGMGGPAMIEGGGLGRFEPTAIGPIEVQRANGVVDLVADDEAHAVDLAKRYLSYFQGAVDSWVEPDAAALRDTVPADRLRAYDMRAVVEGVFDVGSVLPLRAGFGLGMITALARIEGRPVGVIANNPRHLGGAIDSPGADKAARFMQLCDAFGLPIVTLCDTPGMMVGPDVEETALVRHCSRLFVTGANLSVPMVTIVTRKAYGLGAQAMMGGSTKAPLACLAWPTGEFGGMGLEGAVRLGYRAELAEVAEGPERDALFAEMVDRLYAHGRAINVATHFEIDDVIDPASTRRWITTLLAAAPPRRDRAGRSFVDTW
jgi:acetyl-CoA carboxylase carboxyltransferase component